MLLTLVPAMGVTVSAAETWTTVTTYDELKAAHTGSANTRLELVAVKEGGTNVKSFSQTSRFNVTVTAAPVIELTGLTVAPTKVNLDINDTYQLSAVKEPVNAAGSLTWTSDKPVRDVAAATAASTDSTYYVESTEWKAADGTTLAIGDTFRSRTVYTVNITLKTAGTDVFSEKSTYNDIEGKTAAVNPVLTGDAHADSVMKEPTVPTKENFDFDGWYSDKELKTKYDFSAKVTKSITLYAAWTEKDNSINQIILTIGEKAAQVFEQIKTNDVAPKIVNDRTMLPARFVAENLGADVSWDGDKELVTIKGKNLKTGEDVTILIYIGSDIAYVNGKEIKLDYAAFVENDRTYTPIRFISEELGASVEWVEKDKKVIIAKPEIKKAETK